MKKKTKFVLGAALACGVIANFGTAFAIYKNVANAKDFSIGIGSVKSHSDSSDKVTYSIGTIEAYKDSVADGNEIDLTKAKLSPEMSKVVLKAPLSFSYSDNLTAASAQDYATARVDVGVTVDKKLADIKTKDGADTVNVSAQLAGYEKVTVNNNDGTTSIVDSYFTKNKMGDIISETTSTDDSGNTVYSGTIDTAIDTSKVYCLITIDFSSTITETNFLDLAEITNAFAVTVDLSSFDTSTDKNLIPSAYIRGDLSDWDSFDDYQMVPNLNHEGNEVEWTYKLLKGFSKIKVYDENEIVYSSHWVDGRGTDSASVSFDNDKNAILSKDKSYNIYYTRNGKIEQGNAGANKGFWVSATTEDDKIKSSQS